MTKLEQEDEIYWIETNKALAKEIIQLKKQAEQEPMAWTDAQISRAFKNSPELHKDVTSFAAFKRVVKAIEAMHGYAAPARTKDLSDEEITNEWESMGRGFSKYTEFARAVIAADREKNK